MSGKPTMLIAPTRNSRSNSMIKACASGVGAGVIADIAGLLQLIRRSHVPGNVPSQWAECAALAKRCRDMNQQNGALVASRMRRVQGVLNILIGQGADAVPATYSRQLTDSARPSGRVLYLEA